jgi:hypothetical protein
MLRVATTEARRLLRLLRRHQRHPDPATVAMKFNHDICGGRHQRKTRDQGRPSQLDSKQGDSAVGSVAAKVGRRSEPPSRQYADDQGDEGQTSTRIQHRPKMTGAQQLRRSVPPSDDQCGVPDHQRQDHQPRHVSRIEKIHAAPRRMYDVEIQRHCGNRGCVLQHQDEHRNGKDAVSAHTIASQQRETDAEDQVYQTDD